VILAAASPVNARKVPSVASISDVLVIDRRSVDTGCTNAVCERYGIAARGEGAPGRSLSVSRYFNEM
jgi:hypothetical protein